MPVRVTDDNTGRVFVVVVVVVVVCGQDPQSGKRCSAACRSVLFVSLSIRV